MIGNRVRYCGSLDEHWGDYLVVCENLTPHGPRYQLGDRHGHVVRRNVRPESFTVLSNRPQHRVLGLALRAQVAQREIARTIPRAERLPEFGDWIDPPAPPGCST